MKSREKKNQSSNREEKSSHIDVGENGKKVGVSGAMR